MDMRLSAAFVGAREIDAADSRMSLLRLGTSAYNRVVMKRFVPAFVFLVASPHGYSQSKPTITIEQVNRWETELSNWGRWGKDDERGALNLITPQKQVQAARLVKDRSEEHTSELQSP